MAKFKKILASGLITAMLFPVMAYASDKVEYKQPILDGNKQKLGEVICVKDTEDWTKEVKLNVTIQPNKNVKLPEADFTWQLPTETKDPITGTEYKATENGTYKIKVALKDKGYQVDDVTVVIKNIDTKAPEIIEIKKDITEWTNKDVKITVTAEDLQDPIVEETKEEETSETKTEEETKEEKGSGLHKDGAYSFDGGKSWTTSNTLTVSENQTVNVLVRDNLENVVKKEYIVDNIDKTVPKVSLKVSEGKLYEGESGSVIITSEASDDGAGLEDLAYSWDGGKTWYSGPSARVETVGTYTVWIRDKAGNIGTATVDVAYSQKETTGGTTGGSTGSGTNSGTTGGSTGSGTNSGTTGSNTGSGTSSSNTNVNLGNSEWQNNSYISGVVAGQRNEETESERETETESETESETENEKETKKESKKESETESETESKKGLLPFDPTDFNFPIGWVLIGVAILIVLSMIIILGKMIFDRRAALAAEDNEPEEDIEQVYQRVQKESMKVAGVAGVAGAAKTSGKIKKISDEELENIKAPVTEPVNDAVINEEIGASVTEIMGETEVNSAKTPDIDISTTKLPIEEVIAAMGAAAALDENMDPEADGTIQQEIPSAVTEAAETGEKVVIEGAHSRLVFDPETGEYKYEFK